MTAMTANAAINRLPRASFHELARKVKNSVSKPFALQVGAMDGVFFDLLHPLLIEGGWEGLLIEPLPDMFALLQKTYASQPQLKLINCAISDHSGALPLYRIDPEAVTKGFLPKEALGMTTSFSDRGFMGREDYAERFKAHMRKTEVPCRSLLETIGDIPHIDVAVIDTEGSDWMIAQQLDIARFKTRLICIEYSNLRTDELKECCAHLSERGFALALCEEDTENFLFYRE